MEDLTQIFLNKEELFLQIKCKISDLNIRRVLGKVEYKTE